MKIFSITYLLTDPQPTMQEKKQTCKLMECNNLKINWKKVRLDKFNGGVPQYTPGFNILISFCKKIHPFFTMNTK